MIGKKKDSPQVDAAVARAANFEVSIADMARRSERRAWMVAWCAIVMALILAGGYFIFLPLKEKVPYLVMADAYTGTSSVARLTGGFGDSVVGASEALNKSNIAHFVMARESYDYSQFGQQDWNTVHAMGTPKVTSGYARLFAKENPDNPQVLFGKGKSIRIKILSLQLAGAPSMNAVPKAATVRFQRSIYDKSLGVSSPLDSKIAMLEFSYNTHLKMDEPNRILNPLGFQVTSYRVDNDYAASPPLQSEFASPAGTAVPPQTSYEPAGAMQNVTTPALPSPGMEMLAAPGVAPQVPAASAPARASGNANGVSP